MRFTSTSYRASGQKIHNINDNERLEKKNTKTIVILVPFGMWEKGKNKPIMNVQGNNTWAY